MTQAHELSSGFERENIPQFRSGDTVGVNVKVVEGGRERLPI